MIDKLFTAIAPHVAPLLVDVLERIADKKIPDDTVPKFVDGLLGIAQSFSDRAIVVLETTGDRFVEQLAANPIEWITGKLNRR